MLDKNQTRYVVWLSSFLTRRGLQRPDARPLYAYKVTDEEYGQLKDLLCGADYGRKCPAGFCAIWLIFASEWWKRDYTGGAWAWSPLFAASAMHEPDQFAKQDWVESATAYWKLADVITLGKKHIGKVVVNGGLPLKLIKDAGGGLPRLLRTVLVDISKSGVVPSPAHILLEVEAHKHRLPKSYQQKLVYTLLAETLMVAAELKNLCANHQDEDPIRFLDNKHPGWLDRFPLSMDGDAAHKLFSGLIEHAVRFKNKNSLPITVLRRLRFDERGPSRFDCLIEAQSGIDKKGLAILLGCGEDEMPVSFDITARAQGLSKPIGKLVMVSQRYQIKLTEAKMPEAWFYEDIEIEFSRYGQTLFVPELLASPAPDPDSPWIFENNQPIARLIAAGSCKIKDDSCLISTPEQAVMFGNEQRLGTVGDRVIYSDSSQEIHISIKKFAFKIECKAQVASDLAELPRWSGVRLYEASNPAVIFKQKPSLPSTMSCQVSESDLFWACDGQTSKLADVSPRGLGSLIHKKEGTVLSRQRVVCLPENAAIELRPSDETGFGTVILKNWPAGSIASSSGLVSIATEKAGNDWLVKVRSHSLPPPSDFPLTIYWPGGKQELSSVPFPVEGVFFTRSNGEHVPAGAVMQLDLLGDIKAHLLTANITARWEITLRLESNTSRTDFSKKIKYRGTPTFPLREIQLFDIREQARKLMSMSSDLDANIRVSVECNGRTLGSLRFTRYQYAIERNVSTGQVTLAATAQMAAVDSLMETRIRAIHLIEQSQQCDLNPIFSEGVPVGSWEFLPERRMPGCWMIYPDKDSKIDFRPIAWGVADCFATPAKQYDGLRGILSIADKTERMEALFERLAWLADKPNNYDWEILQGFVDTLGHVPLASFDAWVALAKCPSAMAMAILRLEGFHEAIGKRISGELPFEWMLVSPIQWLNAVSKFKEFNLTELGKSERALRSLRHDIEEKTERIRRANPALEFSLNYALQAGLGIEPASKETQRLLAAPDVFALPYCESVMNPEASKLQQLFQRASLQNDGPVTLKRRAVEYAKQSEYASIFTNIRIPSDDWKYSLVMVPFMVAEDVICGRVDDWLQDPSQLHAVREYRDFDPEWFDDAYQLGTFVSYSVNKFRE